MPPPVRPPRRVAEFLDLGGQRAGAAGIRVGDDQLRHLPRGGQREAFPFDRRVALRVLPVENVAVLDKQQRVDDQARNAGEIGKDPLRELGAIDFAALRVEDAQPGPVLFLVDREQLVVDGLDKTGRPPRLALDLEPVRGQRLDKAGQAGIAEPLVIGARLSETGSPRSPRPRRRMSGCRPSARTAWPAMRGADLPHRRPGEQRENGGRDEPAQRGDRDQHAGPPRTLRHLARHSRRGRNRRTVRRVEPAGLPRRIASSDPSPYGIDDGHTCRSFLRHHTREVPRFYRRMNIADRDAPLAKNAPDLKAILPPCWAIIIRI